MKGGATAGLTAAELSQPPNAWIAHVELSVSMTDPVPSPWLEWGRLCSVEGMDKEGRLAMGGLEHSHPVVHFRLLERNTEGIEHFLVRRNDLWQLDRTSAIYGSPPGDGVSTPHKGGFPWITNPLLCLKSLAHEIP